MLCYYLVNPCQLIMFYKEGKMGLGSSSFLQPKSHPNPNMDQVFCPKLLMANGMKWDLEPYFCTM